MNFHKIQKYLDFLRFVLLVFSCSVLISCFSLKENDCSHTIEVSSYSNIEDASSNKGERQSGFSLTHEKMRVKKYILDFEDRYSIGFGNSKYHYTGTEFVNTLKYFIHISYSPLIIGHFSDFGGGWARLLYTPEQRYEALLFARPTLNLKIDQQNQKSNWNADAGAGILFGIKGILSQNIGFHISIGINQFAHTKDQTGEIGFAWIFKKKNLRKNCESLIYRSSDPHFFR